MRNPAPAAIVALAFALGVAFARGARADDPPPATGYAEPRNVEVPMRDARSLAASVWLPAGEGKWPAIVVQTPYGKDRFRPDLVMDGADVAYVVADWRGFHGSKDAARAGMNRRRGEDGYDVVEWAAAQPWCTGKVGTWGASALGGQQYRTAEEQPPHLACCVPIVAGLTWRYETFHPGGVYRKEYADMMDKLGFGVTDLIQSHPLADAAWRFVEAGAHPERVDVPMLLAGGWFDLHPDQMLEDFARLRSESGEKARGLHRIVMGPWTHHFVASYPVDRGELEVPQAKDWFRAEVRSWFGRWLKEGADPKAPAASSAPVTYYAIGEDSWKTAPSWPPPGGSRGAWHRAAGGARSPEEPGGAAAAESFTHDPENPVPTVGGANLDPRLSGGSHDQREGVLGRKDVLVYRTAPLEEPVSIAGRVVARLTVTCEGADAQVHVRLCDEHPDGRALLLADGARLLSLRSSLASADRVEAGRAYDVEVRLPDLAATFAKGHRILIAVSGSNAPRYEVHPAPATVRVLRGGDHGSRLLLPVAGR